MKSPSLIAVLLAARAAASPAQADKRQGISLPPLIPSIPGVTEPIVSGTPPLPIIQVPTPALPSNPFPVSNIKPKKIGYFWTGAGDSQHAEFLVVTSLDDFSHSIRELLSSITDEIRAKPGGGFFITYMGSAVTTSPGHLVETDANGKITHEWPEDVGGTPPRSVDWENGLILTSDFVVPLSILRPVSALGVQNANTLHLWNLSDRRIISTITIPNWWYPRRQVHPGNPESAALATAIRTGEV
ncbi:hypothetical protein S40285_08596 [Stachybotrys chlorohalonatus IBT 40285]|uniref:Uncharacterized protein n=1 Tax=Stachybotrys chlorohalonatus (strain IBT 40285) TaxID=1283841 RepID=A0A084QZC5_STAC4|nr:hypothetical protein S40285_08596 [Stachybotrys chlorohalonata IBT 40285]